MSRQDSSNFYVYVLMDTRRRVQSTYFGVDFDYEIFYIGKGSGNRTKSTIYSKGVKLGSKHHKISEIHKAGYKVRGKKVIKGVTEDKAFSLESKLIYLVGRRDLGTGTLTNKTSGGQGIVGYVMSEEHKQKIRRSLLGRTLSEDHMAKLKNAIRPPITEKTRQKRSDSLKKVPRTKEWRQKISESLKGRALSDAHRQSLRDSHLGYVMPDAQKERIRQSMLKHHNGK